MTERTPHLSRVLDRFDAAAIADPRLERYRLGAKPNFGIGMPGDFPDQSPGVSPLVGWHLSDDLQSLLRLGGWWPTNRFSCYRREPQFRLLLNYPSLLKVSLMGDEWFPEELDLTVRWFGITSTWQEIAFCVPALREPQPSAPIWIDDYEGGPNIFAFPTEASFIETLLVTYETLGYDDEADEIPLTHWLQELVEPRESRRHLEEGELLVREALASVVPTWETTHPLWVEGLMPFNSEKTLDWPLVAHLLGAPLDSRPPHYPESAGRHRRDVIRLPD